jgi:nucleotide sugar dehydrogenase
MSNITVGIIGCGFVGSSIRTGLYEKNKVETYDKYNQDLSTVNNLEELVSKSNILFVCLPTPMRQDGSCDTSLVEQTVLQIDGIANANRYGSKIIVIKSTVPPGTTQRLQQESSQTVDVIFNPEFLTEANHIEDFKNQKRIVLGGDKCKSSLETIKAMYMRQFPEVPYVICGSLEAEITKYFCNCYLATKVSFANEMRQLCDSLNADYNRVVEASVYDTRIGTSHFSVPGPDGKKGFGGSCFPKDVNAMIYIMQQIGVTPKVLQAVWEKNLEVRPEKDWEKLKGRAVIDE